MKIIITIILPDRHPLITGQTQIAPANRWATQPIFFLERAFI